MSITIIIKDGKPRGKTRTSLDKEMQDKWGSTSFSDDEAREKCAFVERQAKKKLGVDDVQVPATIFNRMGRRVRK